MHSDLLSDSERIVRGRRPHKQNLKGLFSIYHKFDKLVSVSESTMEVNRKNLSIYADESLFDFVMNSLNFNKILETSILELDENPSFPKPSKDDINFVTMGRLSPEKGHDNLIKSFDLFHEKHKNSKLYILGSGKLKKELQSLIEELNLEDSVFLTGQVDSPFSLLKSCDCFVLSSHYEGQPMVLLEALTLKMNIIATDIVANRYVLENGKYGILVDNSVEGIKDGFDKFVKNGKKSHSEIFDYETYNKKAMDSFYKAIQN